MPMYTIPTRERRTTMSEKAREMVYMMMIIFSMFFGLWMGIAVGERLQSQKIVIDNEFLIYDSVLYQEVIYE